MDLSFNAISLTEKPHIISLAGIRDTSKRIGTTISEAIITKLAYGDSFFLNFQLNGTDESGFLHVSPDLWFI